MLNLEGRKHAHEIVVLRATPQDLAGIGLPIKAVILVLRSFRISV